MAKYLKKADPNHMITVGEEGFYTKGSSGEAVNPGTGWASLTGQDFIANHASPAIDFAAAHIWPDNWEVRGHLLESMFNQCLLHLCLCLQYVQMSLSNPRRFMSFFRYPGPWSVACVCGLLIVSRLCPLLNPTTPPYSPAHCIIQPGQSRVSSMLH